MDAVVFRRLAWFYIAIQVAIWVKVALFFAWTGRGMTPEHIDWFSFESLLDPTRLITLPFASPLVFADVLFHQIAHFLILVNVFFLAQQTRRFNGLTLGVLFILAAVLHNIGYWLTGVFVSVPEAAADFAMDVVLLFGFTFLFRWLLPRLAFLRNRRIPFLAR